MSIETSKENKRSRLWNLLGMMAVTAFLFFIYRKVPLIIHWWTRRPLDEIGDFGWEYVQKNIMANYTLAFGIWTSIVMTYATRTMIPDNGFGPNLSRWSVLFCLYLLCYCLVMT
mgnify:CR=1 FL=1